MIFVTVGSHEPFDRLIEAVDHVVPLFPGESFEGQITERAGYSPKNFPFVATMAPAAYEEKCREATLIVAHAGMGTVITALRLGTPLVMLARRAQFNETRNDHQHDTAMKLASKRGLFLADTAEDIERAIRDALAYQFDGEAIADVADDRLIAFLKRQLA